VVTATGCAAIAGLDAYSRCAGECSDASVTHVSNESGDPRTDATREVDATVDAAHDASDALADRQGDADARGPDAGRDGAEPDAADTGGEDVDCGPTDTIQSCGACGRACETTRSTDAGCAGGACTYGGCSSGWSDCDQAQPNTNGCECHTPACCSGGACQTAHSNGTGQTFYDCVPQGTYTLTQAMAACAAFSGGSGQCSQQSTTALCSMSMQSKGVCSSSGSQCWCWQYQGFAPGTVEALMGPIGCPGVCPVGGQTTWN
jgi:hypothetical protein